MAGINEADAAQAMRDYTGVVFDIGHQSVGYEDIPTSLQKLVDDGIQITKLQEAASMSMPEVTQKTVDALQAYAKTVYLSQTCEQKDGKTTWYPEPRGRVRSVPEGPGPARVAHALPRAGVPRRSRRRSARRASRWSRRWRSTRRRRSRDHLEIETYTWDVLPSHLKTGDIVEYVTREIDWVKGQVT